MKFLKYSLIINFIVVLFVLWSFTPVYCGETGILQGTVYDKDTGEALPGANIKIESAMLMSTAITTVTDLDGKFIMTGLAPGKYDVSCLFLGFTPMKINDVGIRINRSTTQDFYLISEEVLKKEIEVRAKAGPIIDKGKSGTTEIIDSEYIESLPIEGRAFQQVLKVLPGVFMDSDQQIHIRGGQSGTVGWSIDGISAQDPRSGGYFNINMSAVEEVEVITGGADARYGNNMSGQVNVVTKSGTDTYHGTIEFNYQNNDWYGSEVNNRLYNPIFTLGGPIIKDKLTFFASMELEDTKAGFPAAEFDQDDFQDALWEELNFFGKATYQMTPDDKWIFTYRRNDIETRSGAERVYDWRLITRTQFATSYSLNYTHLFTPKQYADFTVHFYSSDFAGIMKDEDGNDKDWTEYEPYVLFNNDANNSIEWNDRVFYPLVGNILGDQPYYYWYNVEQVSYQGQYVTGDLLDSHYFYIGGAVQDVRLRGESIILPIYVMDLYDYLYRRDKLHEKVDPTINYQQKYYLDYNRMDVRTTFSSFYIADLWDLSEDIKVPIGLTPGFRIDYDEFTSNIVASPRFGLSYSPNDKTQFRFNYGWFFQFIPLGYYAAPDRYRRYHLSPEGFFSPGSVGQASFMRPGKLGTLYTRGIEELENPVNIAYEFNIERQLSENTSLQVNLWYRDMKDLIDEFDRNPDPSITELELINLSKAWAAGIEFNFTKRLSDNWYAKLAYTYIESKSTGIDEDGQVIDEMFWVDWDYRHSGSASLMWQAPWDITVITFFEYRTGLPYSPQRLEKEIKSDGTFNYIRVEESINTARYPDFKKFDITVEKMFTIMKNYKLYLVLQVYNVFDNRNPRYETTYNSDIDRLTGDILEWQEGRTMQFGVKFEF